MGRWDITANEKMKKLLSILLIACFIISCDSTSKIEKDAKQTCNELFTELAKDPSSVNLSNFRTVYKTDSICILHLVFTAKNGLGVETSDDMEYIYFIGDDNKIYDSYVDLSDNDSIYVEETALNILKKGTFYESLDYTNAMKHRVITQLNDEGRIIGSPNDVVNIEPLVKTGKWELKYYRDEFGEFGNNSYLVLDGSGVFSNSATTNSEMSAILFVDKESVSLRLVEYRSSVVKDDDLFDLKVKDKDGEITKFNLYNTKSGYMYFRNYTSTYLKETHYDDIMKILKKEGVIRCSGIMHNSYSSSSYTFSFNLDGFNEAISYVK